mgnify:FL=1
MATIDTLVYNFKRELQFVVTINGVQIVGVNPLSDTGTPAISSIRVSKALDSPVPQCDLELSHIPTWITRGMKVYVALGYQGALAVQVFNGYVQDRSRKVAGGTVKCLGKLYSLSRTIEIGARDVSGLTVAQAIADIMVDTNTVSSITVDAFTLNTSGQPTMTLERMPAIQMVQQLADIDGSRIYEGNDGTVFVRTIEEIPGPTAAYSYSTNSQATAIILAGSDREDPDYFRDKVLVTGATLAADGETEATSLTATALLVNSGGLIQPPLPSGSHIGTEYSNQLIDTQAQCDALATLLLTRYARIPRYLTLEIAGDPRVDIGMTVGLDFAEMGISSSLWFVQGISHSVDKNQGFRTQLKLRGGDTIGGTIDLAPVASFAATAEREVMGGAEILVVTLDASASYSPGGNTPLTYVWTSNQPGTMGSGEILNVNFDTAGWVGDWIVTLTVTDSLGASSVTTQTIDYSSGSATVIIPAIYAALNNNMSATLDGGKNWNDSSHSTTICVAARPSDGVNFGHALFGDTIGRIYRTTDGCATAPTLVYTSAAGVAINDLQWDWRNGNVCWAIDENCIVYISLDAGATWTIYESLRTVLSLAGALGNKIGLPVAGGVYIFGGTGAGSPLIAYDPVVGSHLWVQQTFTGDLLTDAVTTPADATMRIIDYTATGGGSEAMILAWASGGGAALVAIYMTDVTTSPPGASRAFTRATGLTAGMKTGRFIVSNSLNEFYAGFADRDVWANTSGYGWSIKTANLFPANTVPWHCLWMGMNNGAVTSAFLVALEDTVTPNNGYIVKTVDGFVTAPQVRPTTGNVTTTWPASSKGMRLATGAAGATVSTSSGVQFAQGTYTGDGTAIKAITGLGFRPKAVIIKGNSAVEGHAVVRTATMTASRPVTNSTGGPGISSLDEDGFTVAYGAADASNTNELGTVYYWYAFGGQSVVAGSYTGNGGTKNVTGIGFQPVMAWVGLSATGGAMRFRTTDMGANDLDFAANSGSATAITSLDADGFTLGSNSDVNTNGTVYYYVAFNSSGNLAVGTYTGNGSDSRNLPASALSFDPTCAHIKGELGQEAVFKTASLAGDAAFQYGSVVAVTNRIQSIAATTGQFQVGTDAEVNNSPSTYYFFAVKPYSGLDGIVF